MKKNSICKRVMSGLLAVICVSGYIPVPAIASETANLCEHHPEHTTECGYTESVPEVTCSHTHDITCYETVTSCLHIEHDSDCGYVPATEGTSCDCAAAEDGSVTHVENCGYTEGTSEIPCGHACSIESGCVTSVLNCIHSDDGLCCYVPAQEGSPCTYECADCTGEENLFSDTEGGESLPSAGDTTPAPTVCTCLTTCVDNAVNSECVVCAEDYSACEYVEAYEVYVGNTQITAENAADVFGDGTVSYDAETNTLTLINAVINDFYTAESGDSYGIYAADDLTVVTDGTNTVAYEIYTDGELTLDGEGVLIEGIDETVTTVLSDYTLTEDLTIDGTWNFVNGAKIAAGDYTVVVSENAVVMVDGEEHTHDTDGEVTYGTVENDPASHMIITFCEECPIGYAEEVTEQHYAADETGMCVCGISTVAAAVENGITLGETLSVNVSAGEIVKIPFTPTVTHYYAFTSTLSSGDTYGYIYNANEKQLAYNDDGAGSGQFLISYKLEAGTTYYLGVKWYNSSASGTIPVMLQYDKHVFTEDSGKNTCSECDEVFETLNFDNPLDVELTAGELETLIFTPVTTHSYKFTTSAATYIYIYDDAGKQVANTSNSTVLLCNLTANTTYSITIRYGNGTAEGTISVKAEQAHHYYSKQEGESVTYVCTCGETAEQITLGETRNLAVAEGKTTTVPFVAPYDHAYKFTTTETVNKTYIEIYQGSTSQTSSSGTPFSYIYSLTAGTLYNLGVGYSSTTVSGTIPLKVELVNHNYMKQSDGTYLCSCGKTSYAIELHKVKEVEVAAKEIVKIPFTPEITHAYIFAGTVAASDTGYIYKENETSSSMASNSGSATLPFIVTSTLNAGITYNLGVYSSTGGTIPVILALGPHDFQQQDNGGYKCSCGATSDSITVGAETNVTIPANQFVTVPYEPALTHPCKFTGGNGADGDIIAAVYSSTTNRQSTTTTFADPFSCLYTSYNQGSKYYLVVGNLSDTERTIPIKLDYIDHTYVKNEETGIFACICGAVKDTVVLGQVIDVDIIAGETVKLPFVPKYTHSYRYIGWSDKSMTGYIYNSAGTSLVSSNSNPFNMTRDLDADSTYYLGFNSQSDNSAEIIVDYNSHSFEPQTDGSYKCECGVGWKFEDGTLTLFGNGGIGFYTSSSTTPWKDYTTQIKSVVIEDGITSIGNYAFYGCTNLSEVTIADSVAYIGENVFYNCDKLTEIDIPEGVVYIGSKAFYDCDGLTEVVVPDSVRSMGTEVFRNCSNLITVKLSSNLAKIPTSTFYYCAKLADITLPQNCTSIESYAFCDCDKLTEFTVPATVTSIGDSAFKSCDGLTKVVIPDSVTTMGTEVFRYCYNMTSAVLPKHMKKIPSYTFSGCTKLADITLPENYTSIANSAFYDCDKLTEFTIPDTVTSIGYQAFYSCDGLTEIVVPNSVTTMDTEVFYGCSNLTRAVLPKDLETIPSGTFRSCSKLTDITFPENYTSIGSEAFYQCYGLTDIVIREGATTIEDSAFYECTSLSVVDIPDTVTSIGSSAFSSCYGLNEIEIPSSVTSIGTDAFYNCSELKEVKFDAKNCTVSSGAFTPCSSLKTVTIGKNVDVLSEAFWNSGITTAKEVIFEGENYFTTSAISSNGKLSVPLKGLPAGNYYADEKGVLYRIEENGSATLVYCPAGIETLTVPDSVTDKDGSFCHVTKVGSYALKEADDLTAVIFESPETIEKLESFAMADCYKLASVNGDTTVTGTKKLFTGADIGINVFENTLLKDDDESTPDYTVDGTLVSDAIKIYGSIANAEPILSLTTDCGEYYTGETCVTSIVVSNAGSEGKIIRVYFQFSDTDGKINNYSVGEYPVLSPLSGKTYMFNMCATESDLIYYMELEQPDAGDTFSVVVNTYYPSTDSDGGSVRIWGEVLTEDENKAIGNAIIKPTEYHQATWETLRDDFPITKEAYTSVNPSLIGDGKENGLIFVKDLKYSIKMTRTENRLKERDTDGKLSQQDRDNNVTSLGNDFIKRFEYEDILTLPEGTYWRDGVIQAIKDKNYRIVINSSNYTYYYVTLSDGSEVLLCTLYNSTGDSYTYRTAQLALTENGDNIVIKWSRRNAKSDAEISVYNVDITYGPEVICVKPEDVENNTFEFRNNVAVRKVYTHSEDVVDFDDAIVSVIAGSADINLIKAATDEFGSYGSWLGDRRNYKITVKNFTALPYNNLKSIYDNMPNYFYIKPEDMQRMFDMDKEDLRAVLSIKIEDATLCGDVDEGKVTAVDGEEYYVENANTGVNTEYHGTEPEDSVGTVKADILLKWADNGTSIDITVTDAASDNELYKFTVTAGSEPDAENGIYPSIESALDSIGYLVTNSTRFTPTWDIAENFTIVGGQEEYFYIFSTLKDSFMYTDVDVTSNVSDPDKLNNTAYAVCGEEGATKSASSSIDPNIDFYLNKYGYIDGIQMTPNTNIEAYDVIHNKLQLSHRTSSSSASAYYEILPLVDHLQGGQVLLVPLKDNEFLKDEPYNLEPEIVSEGDNRKSYFVLDINTIPDGEESRTFYGITLGGYLTDSIVVTKSKAEGENLSGLNTLIRWYLTDIKGYITKTLEYESYIDPDRAGCEGIKYWINNEVWANDHQSHRLWCPIGEIPTIRMSFDKSIVTKRGTTPDSDSLTDYSLLREGEKVTYRFTLRTTSVNASTITGDAIYDVLPSSIKNFWKKEDMTVTYVDANGETVGDNASTDVLTVVNGDKWDVWDAKTQGSSTDMRQQIHWDSEFSLTFYDVVYIYVTIKCPSDTVDENGNPIDTWTEFAGEYSNVRLENNLYVHQMMDTVYHDVAIPSEAVLYKGVYQAGIKAPSTSYYTYSTSENSRLYYENDDAYQRLVFYYVTLYNSGDNRLYINDMQDILPKGFTFYGMLYNDSSYYSNRINADSSEGNSAHTGRSTLASLTDADKSSITWKYANIAASTDMTDSGNQRIIFKLSNYDTSSSSLQYDEYVGKYYLSPGEGVKFAYACRTNNADATEDVATNSIVMPYYDHTGSGVKVSDNVTVKGQTRGKAKENDGGCELIDTIEANSIGYEGGDETTQWLYSEVTMKRMSIVPGITKYTKGKVANANISDTIDWEVTAYNDGGSAIMNYTITDVMQSPYEFTGTVKYTINYIVYNTSYKIISNLFEIDRSNKDENGKIESFDIYSLYSGGSRNTKYTLTVGGDAVKITSYYKNDGSGISNATTAIEVRLERDENGNLKLKIHFPDNAMSIPEEGNALLEISTKNTTVHQNKIYYNTAYFTPNGQIFEDSSVTKGNIVTYDNEPSVQANCPITVSMGYITSSEKSVEQKDYPDNKASCNDNVNYIILPTKDTLFNYTLCVNNTTGKDMDNLILIDNLPQKDDHFTFAETKARNSKFTVVFADDPNFIVMVKGNDGSEKVLEKTQYRIEYTDSVVFTPDDWKGITHETETEGATVWYSTPNDRTRSFRIVITAPTVANDDGSTTKASLVPEDTSVYVQFTAKIDEDDKATVLPGEIAWNSFGYHYNLVGISAELEAAPPEVGIMIPTAPKLKKELKLEGEMTPYTAVSDETFRFLIYNSTGKDITLSANYTEAQLAQALADAECDYTYVELEVKEGKSESAQMLLKDAVHYTYNETDGWIEKLVEQTEAIPEGSEGTETTSGTAIPWNWINGETYTIIELPLMEGQEEFTVGEINGNSNNSYTFTYNNAATVVITAVNYRKTWDISMIKTDSVTESGISGAVFALYSPYQADSITEEQHSDWEALYNITIPMTVTVNLDAEESTEDGSAEAIEENSTANMEEKTKTYYLMQVAVSGANGQIKWTGLIHHEYCIRELIPPTGYNIDDTPIVVKSENCEDVIGLTVENVMGYVLPETGGIGTVTYTIGGALTITSGLLGYGIMKHKRKKEEY